MAIKKQVKGVLLFISYASKDADFFKIKQIAEELTKSKEIDDALYWQEDMRDDIYAYMDENLKKCDIFLLFCSENSLHSEPVKMEWRAALKIKKKIIPIFTEEKFIPPLLSTKLGLQFDRDNLQKTIAEIYRLIVKKLKIKEKKKEDSEIDEDIFISTSPEIKKKYDYFVNLGKSYEKSKQYQEALNNYQKAHKISEKLYDATLTIEIENLIKGAKGLMQHDLKVKEKELEEKANQLTPTLKASLQSKIHASINELSKEVTAPIEIVKYALDKFAIWDADSNEFWINQEELQKSRLQTVVSFRGSQILQFEAEILETLENNLNKKFTLVDKVKHNTTMGFSFENNRITGIGLHNCEVSSLPEALGKLTALKFLGLRDNKLETLPESIGNLEFLNELRLEKNQLTVLPWSIGNLSSLEMLSLFDNKLAIFPESICNLSSLKCVFGSNNQLTSLPESIGNLKSLQELHLFDNSLTLLPKSIGDLKSLKFIYLENNKIKQLPKSIGNLESLEWLSLSNNDLQFLPDSISKLASLLDLYLEENKFMSLPDSIGNFKNLRSLHLENNKLIGIPAAIGKLQSLSSLYLEGNELSFLPESILTLNSLRSLDLRNNPLSNSPDKSTKKLLEDLKRKGVFIKAKDEN